MAMESEDLDCKMRCLFTRKTESGLSGKSRDLALHSLLHRLPRAEMLAFGKTCSLLNVTAKKVHEKRVIEAFSSYLYNDTPLVEGQLRKGLIRRRNASTDQENVFFAHQIKGAIDVVGTDIDLEWEDRDVTKFLFWEMGTVAVVLFEPYASLQCIPIDIAPVLLVAGQDGRCTRHHFGCPHIHSSGSGFRGGNCRPIGRDDRLARYHSGVDGCG